MATKIASTIKFDGPFFRQSPAKTFRQNVRVMMDAVAAEGQADVRAQLESGNSSRSPIAVIGGHVSDHAIGRTHALTGKRWAVSAVVSVNNSGLSRRGGIALMAAAATVERKMHAFRRTTTRLRKARAVNVAELLRGIR